LHFSPHYFAHLQRIFQARVVSATVECGGNGEEGFADFQLRLGGLRSQSPRTQQRQARDRQTKEKDK
jgi:hypothetical protein